MWFLFLFHTVFQKLHTGSNIAEHVVKKLKNRGDGQGAHEQQSITKHKKRCGLFRQQHTLLRLYTKAYASFRKKRVIFYIKLLFCLVTIAYIDMSTGLFGSSCKNSRVQERNHVACVKLLAVCLHNRFNTHLCCQSLIIKISDIKHLCFIMQQALLILHFLAVLL